MLERVHPPAYQSECSVVDPHTDMAVRPSAHQWLPAAVHDRVYSAALPGARAAIPIVRCSAVRRLLCV
jgi:hypothetical protein